MDKFSKHVKSVNKLSVFFLLFFALACIGAGFLINQSTAKYKREGIKATAEITDFERGFSGSDDIYAIVKFTVDGKKIEGRLNYYTASMRKGDIITVYYMEDNPYDFVYGDSQAVITVITFSVGGVLFAISIATLVSAPIKKSKLNKLKTNGHRKQITVKEIKINWTTTINGMHPAKIICHDATGKEYVQKVRIFNESDYSVGDKLDIYVDVDNPSKYVFDMQSLTKVNHQTPPQEPFEF